MKEPVLILSDLHLGHSGSVIDDASKLIPLLGDASTLILNGDTWQELSRDFQVEGRKQWEKWQTICRDRGIDLICLPGNHDPGQGNLNYVELAGKRIVIMHGDAIFPNVAPWSRTALRMQEELRTIIEVHPQDEVEDRFALAKKISRALIPPHYPRRKNLLSRVWDAVTPPSRAWHMILSWATMVGETKKFALRYFPRAEVMICGHFHRCGIWDDPQLLVINSGSFMPPGAAYWCEYREGQLRVGTMTHKTEEWHRAEVIGHWILDKD